MAKIYFHRNSSIVGAAVPYLVVDRLDTLNFNAFRNQKKDIKPNPATYTFSLNVKHMYLTASGNKNILLCGKNSKDDVFINKGIGTDLFGSKDSIPPALEQYLNKFSMVYINYNEFKANVRCVGSLATSHTLSWEVPAGLMQLETITGGLYYITGMPGHAKGGAQLVSDPIKVESGKTYLITNTAASDKFEIEEINEEEYLQSLEE